MASIRKTKKALKREDRTNYVGFLRDGISPEEELRMVNKIMEDAKDFMRFGSRKPMGSAMGGIEPRSFFG